MSAGTHGTLKNTKKSAVINSLFLLNAMTRSSPTCSRKK
jgi:hypothetical protein